jgi:DNA-binding NarL/FixJ family response regulator
MPSSLLSITVFLAEDSELIRSRIAEMLHGNGQTATPTSAMTVVGQASSPQACIDAILIARPDVVVLDIQLQGGSGLEVLHAVREAAPATQFVMFSHHSSDGYRELYLREGAACFLDKNSEFDQLPRAIENAARRAHLRLPDSIEIQPTEGK